MKKEKKEIPGGGKGWGNIKKTEQAKNQVLITQWSKQYKGVKGDGEGDRSNVLSKDVFYVLRKLITRRWYLRSRVPEPDRLVVRYGRDLLPVWREYHGINPIRMAFEDIARLPRGRVPESDRLV